MGSHVRIVLLKRVIKLQRKHVQAEVEQTCNKLHSLTNVHKSEKQQSCNLVPKDFNLNARIKYQSLHGSGTYSHVIAASSKRNFYLQECRVAGELSQHYMVRN